MKRFLFLAVTLIMSVCGAWAVDELGNAKLYNELTSGMEIALKCCSNTNGGYLYLAADKTTSKATFDDACTFVLEDAGDGKVYLKSKSTGYYIGNNASVVEKSSATAFSLQNPSTNFNGDTALTEDINTCTRFADGGNFLNCQGLGDTAKFAGGTGAWSFFKVYEVVAATAKTYTVSIEEGLKITYNDQQYGNGEQFSATGLTPADITAPAVEGYWPATVNISDATITVTYAALPFQAAASFDAIEHWYAMTIHSNQTHYLYTDDTGAILCNNEAYETNEYYAWGFVGNMTDGYTVYNKATGASVALDSNTPCALSDAGLTAAWILSKSSETSAKGQAGFCLHVDGQQYVNYQGGQLQRWGSADAGSTFNVEELVLEEEPVADLPFTVGKKYVVWFNNAAKQYFWEDRDGVANEIRCADGDINTRDELESYSSTVYWTMGGNATNGYTFTNVATGKSLVAPTTLSAGAAFLLSDSEATGFDVVKQENGYYRFYIHGQTTYYLAHTSRNSHLVTMYSDQAFGSTYGLTTDGGASVVQFEEIPDHYDYTLTLVDAPESAVVTIGGEARANGAKFTSNGRITSNDITVQVEGYTYSIDITTSEVTITFKKLPITAGKKYVISSVGHANDAVYYITNDGTNTELARGTEYPAEAQYWTAESVSIAENGGINVSFVNNGKYFAFMATTDEAGHAVTITQDDVDADNFYNVQDYLNYWPAKSTDTRFLYLAVKDDNTAIGWGAWQGTGIRSTGYSYQFKFDEITEEEPVQYTEGDFYVKNVGNGKYFGFVGTTLSDGNFGPVEEANKLVCTVTQPEAGTFNIQLQGFNYVSCGSNGGFSNNKTANALKLFKVNGNQADEVNAIEEGAEYLIVGTKNDVTYAISNGTNGKTGADLRTAGIAVSIVKGHILDIYNACKWTFEPYVNTDTREALNAVYIKNGEGKYFGIGGEGDDVNLLDEGQTWNIAPVAVDPNAYTLENAELDATKRFINSGTNGYTSKGEDYNARDIFFYELTNATTGECTLVAQPELGKTYAMVIQNVTTSYAGYYVIYSGLAKNKTDRGDVIALNVDELPTTLTITEALSSSNGAITPAKALWTLTDKAEEPVGPLDPDTETLYFTAEQLRNEVANVGQALIGILGVTTTANKYINGAVTTSDVSADGTLAAARGPQDSELMEVLPAEGGYYLRQHAAEAGQGYLACAAGGNFSVVAEDGASVWTIVGPSEEGYGSISGYDDLYTDIAQELNDNMLRFISSGQYLNGQGAGVTGGLRGGTGAWSFNYIRNANYEEEEPVGPIEPEFPLTGQPYILKEKTSGMYLNVISNSENNAKDVILKKKSQDLYFTAVEGGYTITTADGLYVGGFSNGWNMSSQIAQTWQVEEVEGGYALKNVDNGKYLGFNTVESEGAAAFRDKNYATDYGIFEFELNVFPAEGKAYQFKEKDSGMYLNVISDSQDRKKDVVLKKAAQALYFTAVEGGYTIATENGLYVGASPANGWNMDSRYAQTWVVEEVEGGYALRTADAGKYLGFDTVDNEGAAAYRDKSYSANHGIFEITAYGTAELTAKDKLAAAIEEAKALNTTDVPEDLVETLQNAIEMAEGVLGDALATDADYDEARGILEHAANAVKNYVPQTPAEMLADLKAAMEQAAVILSANKVEGAINETTYEYELTSTVAGQVGYKPYDEVFNIGEDIAVLNWYLNLAGNDADALEALLNEVDWSIRMCTAELVDFIAAYEAAGWVLPEKDKTYIIRSAPDQYSWAFYNNEGTLALSKWNTVKDDLTSAYAWTCKGLEDYNIVNSDLEVENLGQRVRFTSLAHPEQYLCWKGVTDNAKAGNTYWQISGKNSPQYGAMSMQAFDGSNHYKYLTIEVYEGSMNHGDSWNWVNNSTFSSWYTFEEVDPNQFEDVVGIGTVIAPADNALRFNLQGQRIAKDVRGINIVNGKKLIRK